MRFRDVKRLFMLIPAGLLLLSQIPRGVIQIIKLRLMKCRYAGRCTYFNHDSFTCMNISDYERRYCGRYRRLDDEGKD